MLHSEPRSLYRPGKASWLADKVESQKRAVASLSVDGENGYGDSVGDGAHGDV